MSGNQRAEIERRISYLAYNSQTKTGAKNTYKTQEQKRKKQGHAIKKQHWAKFILGFYTQCELFLGEWSSIFFQNY